MYNAVLDHVKTSSSFPSCSTLASNKHRAQKPHRPQLISSFQHPSCLFCIKHLYFLMYKGDPPTSTKRSPPSSTSKGIWIFLKSDKLNAVRPDRSPPAQLAWLSLNGECKHQDSQACWLSSFYFEEPPMPKKATTEAACQPAPLVHTLNA